MLKLLRVDHRLLHGQVAFSWTQNLGADCILIANDDVPQNLDVVNLIIQIEEAIAFVHTVFHENRTAFINASAAVYNHHVLAV